MKVLITDFPETGIELELRTDDGNLYGRCKITATGVIWREPWEREVTRKRQPATWREFRAAGRKNFK